MVGDHGQNYRSGYPCLILRYRMISGIDYICHLFQCLSFPFLSFISVIYWPPSIKPLSNYSVNKLRLKIRPMTLGQRHFFMFFFSPSVQRCVPYVLFLNQQFISYLICQSSIKSNETFKTLCLTLSNYLHVDGYLARLAHDYSR